VNPAVPTVRFTIVQHAATAFDPGGIRLQRHLHSSHRRERSGTSHGRKGCPSTVSATRGASARSDWSRWHDHDHQIDEHHPAPDGGAAARHHCVNSRAIAAAPAAHVIRQLTGPKPAAGRGSCAPKSMRQRAWIKEIPYYEARLPPRSSEDRSADGRSGRGARHDLAADCARASHRPCTSTGTYPRRPELFRRLSVG